jgi:CRP-like cAMP-binding protein
MSMMIPLRIAAIASNVLFIAFGYWAELPPVLVVNAILLPLNALRLYQFWHLINEVRTGGQREDLSIQSLLPFMTVRKAAAGEVLVRKGEKADRLYYLMTGTMEVCELGKVLEPGSMVGEIGVFAPNQRRIATVVCRTDCVLYELSESKTKQLYFQDRSFGYALLQLIIARLVENSERVPQPKVT